MSSTEPLLIQKLSAQLGYLTERQTLLAKNIANIDTPSYRAQDLKKPDFDAMVKGNGSSLPMRTTSAKHLQSSSAGASRFAIDTNFEAVESKPGGNNVVLEEQMGNISDVGAQHQLTSTLLKKFHQLYRIAVDNKG